MSNPKKYLEQLFISKVRIKSLRYFFMNEEAIHLRAAVREMNEEINAVRRELSRMEEIKLLTSERRGNKKYFKLNTDFLYYDELLAMVHKTFGLGGEIVSNQKKLGDIKFALLTQSFTQGSAFGAHRIDLVIVSDQIDMHELDGIISREERRLSRQINYTVLREHDFEMHKQRRDAFVMELMLQNRVMLIGNSADFSKLPV